MREAQPLIIQAEVMREEMTSCCEVEYTGKSIPLLLHQVIYNKLCRSLGCYVGDLYNTPGKKKSTDECPRFLVTPLLATIRDKKFATKIQHRTSEASLKLLHVYYNHRANVLHTNQEPLDSYLLMVRTKTNRRTDREQYTRSRKLLSV